MGTIDDLLSNAGQVKDRLHEYSEIYFPSDKDFFGKIKNFWDIYKPRSAVDVVNFTMSPPAYYLWKLPEPIHRTLNDVLGYSTHILTELNPELGVATGITYGLSETIYGLKTKSGKRMLSGLIGSLTHMKQLGDEKIKDFAERTLEKLEQYFGKEFQPA